MTAQDLVNAGYYGYRGWGDAEAQADFNATGGAGKGGPTTGGSTGGAQVSVTDLNTLMDKAWNASKDYYIQVAKENQGDYNRAVAAINEDYARGTRIAKEDYARQSGQAQRELGNTLGTLGLKFIGEQEQGINDLNQRGMAVGQMSRPGQYNTLGMSTITPTGPESSSIDNPANLRVGRGGVELARMQQDQQLRQEAVQRATNKTITELGVTLKRATNPTTDRTQMGTTELAQQRDLEDTARRKQLQDQQLFQQRAQEATNLATSTAGLQLKEIPTSLTNKYLQSAQTDFTNLGTTA